MMHNENSMFDTKQSYPQINSYSQKEKVAKRKITATTVT